MAGDTPIPGDVEQRIDAIISGRDSTAAGQNLIRFVDGVDRIEIIGTFTNPSVGVFVGAATGISICENLVYADVNGDRIADFGIIVTGDARLGEDDFFL